MKLLKRPRPYKNESLSNYIKRVSEDNYCKQEWLKSIWGISRNIALGKLNCILLHDRASIIKKYMELTDNEFNELDMDQFGCGLWEKDTNNDLGANKTDFVNEKYTSYCVSCLQQNHYHRNSWQLKHLLICIDHNLLLINKCEMCGEKIKVEDVITGFCSSCGFKLKYATPEKCREQYIVKNQARLYRSFGINCGYINEIAEIKIDMGLDGPCFLYLYNFIYNSLYDNFYNCLRMINRPEIIRLREYSLELQVAFCTEKIIDNFPNSFLDFLEDIYSAIELKNKNNITKYSEYILNPSLIMKNFDTNVLQSSSKFVFLKEMVEQYFAKLAEFDAFKYRFRTEIVAENYIYIDVLHYVLGIDENDSLEAMFRTVPPHEVKLDFYGYRYYSGYRLVNFQDLYKFIRKISDMMEIINKFDIELATIQQFRELFYDDILINYSSIYNLIFDNKVKLYVYDYKAYHVNQIYVNKSFIDLFEESWN